MENLEKKVDDLTELVKQLKTTLDETHKIIFNCFSPNRGKGNSTTITNIDSPVKAREY